MKKQFSYFPGRKFYTLQELEEFLQFHYLEQITFETPADREEIKARGMDQWQQNKVSQESVELGLRWVKNIESASIPQVSIRLLGKDLGHGLFAEEDLEEGSYVGEYTGVIRRNDRRYFEPQNNYCYKYPVPDEMGRDFVIDATQGNLTRFINHSFNPNLRPIHVFYEGFYHLIFLALQRIKKGTQLSYNYGQNYWAIRQAPLSF